MCWFSLEDERVMQQSSVSISLVPTQTNKNLATNAINGLSIPSRPLARVRYDRYYNNKINIFVIFNDVDLKVKIANNDRSETYMIKDRPRGHWFH